MKTPFALFILLAASATATAAPHSLLVEVQPRFANAPLMFDAMTNVTAAGQTVSVTRLDFLLSNIALRRADGTWFTLTNRFGYISGRERRTMVALPSLPPGDYGRIRFHVGVPERENHANPGALAASHPLNPNVNGLHGSWQGGYVFFALEGIWGADRGYSYHIATDRRLATVELPLALKLEGDDTLRLVSSAGSRVHRRQPALQLRSRRSRRHAQCDAVVQSRVEKCLLLGRPRAQPSRASAPTHREPH